MYVILLLMVLLSVAFVTLMERKILGYMQLRKGPNKLFLIGVFQPLADGLKLFFKENVMNFNMNKMLFSFFPSLSFFLMLILWVLYNFVYLNVISMNIILFMLVSSAGVYTVMGMGWSSNSKYALLGAHRGVAQTVSYEVTMVFILITVFFMSKSYNLSSMVMIEDTYIWYFMMCMCFMLIWTTVVVAELNRAPFDFAEGESELVSGFNVEYGGGKFALIFLAEYGNIIFLSYLTVELFLNSFFMLLSLLYIMLIVWLRGTYVRYRYDNLMYLNWKVFLPFVLLFFLLFIFIVHFYYW